MISAVAEMYEIHPQTLRLYEREGLLKPSRTEGNTRLYTDEDLERLEFILNLARDLGVNIAGIAIILQMRERMEEMNRQMQSFVEYVRTRDAHALPAGRARPVRSHRSHPQAAGRQAGLSKKAVAGDIAIHPATVFILIVIFSATLIRSSIGFGEALIAVPMLAFFISVRVAAPLAVLVSITIAAIVVAQDWRHIHLRSAGWLLAATLFGLPLGLLLLAHGPEQLIKAGLGILILLFALFCLAGSTRLHLHSDNRFWLLICGFIAGILGGAYGINGPPLAVYGALRRWPAQHFRATLQAYFLPASILGMCGFWSAGLWTSEVTTDYLICLPAIIPAVLLGRAINRRLSAAAFSRYLYLGLAAIGMALLLQSLAQFRQGSVAHPGSAQVRVMLLRERSKTLLVSVADSARTPPPLQFR